jgi:hypothetical protein
VLCSAVVEALTENFLVLSSSALLQRAAHTLASAAGIVCLHQLSFTQVALLLRHAVLYNTAAGAVCNVCKPVGRRSINT